MNTIAQKSWPRLQQKFAENLHPLFDFDLKPQAFVWKKLFLNDGVLYFTIIIFLFIQTVKIN